MHDKWSAYLCFDLPRASQNTEGSTSSASIYQPLLIVSRLLAIVHLLKNPVLFFIITSNFTEKKTAYCNMRVLFPLYCTTVLHGECVCIYTQVVSVEIYVRNGLSSAGKHTTQSLSLNSLNETHFSASMKPLTHAGVWLTRRLAASAAIGWHRPGQSGLIKSPDGEATGEVEWIVLLPSRVSHPPNVVSVWFRTTKSRRRTSSCELICNILCLAVMWRPEKEFDFAYLKAISNKFKRTRVMSSH